MTPLVREAVEQLGLRKSQICRVLFSKNARACLGHRGPNPPMLDASMDNANYPFAGLFRTGATGLEPATSGVTGLFREDDDWRRLATIGDD